MIKSVRRVLAAILDQHGQNLDDELLRTFLVEAELVVNSRPLAYPDMNSSDSEEPITLTSTPHSKGKGGLPFPRIVCKREHLLSLCRLIYPGFEISQFFVHLILRIIKINSQEKKLSTRENCHESCEVQKSSEIQPPL